MANEILETYAYMRASGVMNRTIINGEQFDSKLPSQLLLDEHIIHINDTERARRSLTAVS